MRPEPMVGHQFGRLIVTARAEDNRHGNARWICLCGCGNETTKLGSTLRSGDTKSCGCLSQPTERAKTHGHSSNGHTSRTYNCWSGIKARCLNPKHLAYSNYGGRGIKICDRWMAFENFLSDVGQCPGREFSLDRIDNDGNYEPGNVRWATYSQQSRNTRKSITVTLRGKTIPALDFINESLKDVLIDGIPLLNWLYKQNIKLWPGRVKRSCLI